MRRTPAFRGRVLPVLEVLLAGLILLWAHVRLDIPPGRIPDYGYPDALFYTMGAENLAEGKGYQVFVNGHALPPKFPPGTSLLLAPWYLFSGKGGASGIGAVQVLAFLLGISVWFAARRRAGPLGGLAALLALESGLCFAAFRNQPVSEVPAALFLFWAFVASTGKAPPGKALLAAGLLAGFGAWIRYPLLVLLPAPLAALEGWKREGRRRAILFAAGAALPLLLLAAWQAWTFHSPFRTGYSLWLPRYHEGARPLFSAAYAFHAPAEGLPGLPNLLYYPLLLAGKGALLLPWPQALAVLSGILLFAAGAARGKRSHLEEAARFTLFSALAFLALYGFYFYQEARLLAPLAPVLALFGAQAAKDLGHRIQVLVPLRGGLLLRAPLLLLLAGNAFFFLALTSAVPTGSIRFDGRTRHAKELEKKVPPGAVLVTGRDILFLSHALPGRLILPRSTRQPWVEALLYRDWKKYLRPGGGFREFRAWEKEGALRPLPGKIVKRFTAPPAPMILPLLEKEGKKVVNDG